MIYIILFYEFIKIGLFTVGGGLATLPFLKDLAERTNWYSVAFITDMIAISESTPGPIGINMATYVGYKVAGILGGVIATIGEIIPSIIIVVIVSRFLTSFRENKNIQYAFYGIRPTVTALIAAAGMGLFRITILHSSFKPINGIIGSSNTNKVLIFIVIFFLIKKYNAHPIIYIAISGFIGIILKLTV